MSQNDNDPAEKKPLAPINVPLRYEFGQILSCTRPIDAFFQEDMFYPMGVGDSLTLAEENNARNTLVLGGSGEGKSSFMQLRCRQHAMHGRGHALLDGNNSTGRDYFAWLAFHRDQLGAAARKVFLFDFDCSLCACDPRAAYGVIEHYLSNTAVGNASLQENLARDMAQILMPKVGETEEDQALQKRRRRALRAAVYCISTPIDAAGNFLPWSVLPAVIDPRAKEHEECYRLVCDKLPWSVRFFIDNLRLLSQRQPQQIDNFLESFHTQLDEVLTPLVLEVFDSRRPSIPIDNIIRNDGILIVCGGKTDHVHEQVGLFFRRYFRKALTNTLRRIPEDQRSDHPFYIEHDEAHQDIDDDYLMFLRECRKYRFSCCLYTQEISGLIR